MSSLDQVSRDMKILVVDDFSTMRRIVKNILQQLGFSNVVEAEDGKVALSKLGEDKIDFVISDWTMPNMMGMDLLKAVRAHEELKDIPFLMVAAESQRGTVSEAITGNEANYIIKPFTVDALQEKMTAIFK